VFDFHDVEVGPLNAQWKIRRNQVYLAHKYKIWDVNPRDILEYGA
jgi:hypothetical protein